MDVDRGSFVFRFFNSLWEIWGRVSCIVMVGFREVFESGVGLKKGINGIKMRVSILKELKFGFGGVRELIGE